MISVFEMSFWEQGALIFGIPVVAVVVLYGLGKALDWLSIQRTEIRKQQASPAMEHARRLKRGNEYIP